MNAPPDAVDLPDALEPGRKSSGDCRGEALARATWSRLAEPADPAACALVAGLGARAALRWLCDEAMDASGRPRPAPRPPLHRAGNVAESAARWEQAAGRWAPRLATLDIRREIDTLERLGGSLVVPGDTWWPTGLDELEHPPFCLWVRGDPALLVARGPGGRQEAGSRHDDAHAQDGNAASPHHPGTGCQDGAGTAGAHTDGVVRTCEVRTRDDLVPDGPGTGTAIAVVGARAATAYGERTATELGADLAERGCLVVSGGAYGIDAAAHRGALHTGRTLSVSAGGVDRLYPAGNDTLLRRVTEVGALVAEVPPGCAPARHRFLTRNRLIAALSDATVVVEAAWRSGALSTAHHAQELGRPLGAVPGPVTSMASVGCHRLLRSGAVCVTGADDALELVLPLGQVDPEARRAADPALTGQGLLDGLAPGAREVLDALPARAGAELASLARAAGLDETATMAALGVLELSGRAYRANGLWRRSPARVGRRAGTAPA